MGLQGAKAALGKKIKTRNMPGLPFTGLHGFCSRSRKLCYGEYSLHVTLLSQLLSPAALASMDPHGLLTRLLLLLTARPASAARTHTHTSLARMQRGMNQGLLERHKGV